MNIARNLAELRRAVPNHVKIIAVSKTKPVNLLQAAYDAGQKAFGENYVQEIVEKHTELPSDIEWHFIGHLQTNKVKNIASFVSYIHAVDSEKLLREIDKQAEKNNRIIHCLLQFHIADEDSKFGFRLDNYLEVIKAIPFHEFKNIKICGVMGMASFVQNQLQIENEFSTLRDIFHHLKNEFFSQNEDFIELSMGMSGDWPLAVDKGSTMIRIGSSLFGNRI